MALDQELIDMMNDTVTLSLAGDVDKYNKITFSAPIEARCYISKTVVQILNREGRETVSTLQIIFADPTLAITEDTRITMPDGSHPDIIRVNAAPDENGDPYYLEVHA